MPKRAFKNIPKLQFPLKWARNKTCYLTSVYYREVCIPF